MTVNQTKMLFSKLALLYFLSTTRVSAGETSTRTINDDVGDGEANKMSFSLSHANKDGSACAPCVLCEGSALNNVLDQKTSSLCVRCADDASCEEAIMTNSFQKACHMTRTSLTSHEGDASLQVIICSRHCMHINTNYA